ncbi:MAG: ATP-dependent Clp protease adaptor ClpS [Candidatus Kapabacteria bacterium]|nr:ATP-dependent Clp protease adaptor ClpS [Candidatus Kapabacteria bacterium]
MHNDTVFLGIPQLEEDQLTLGLEEVALTAKVILFNDEVHTFDEVIIQIMKATGCTLDRAELLTLEVHHSGKAMVYEGGFPPCLRVSSILEEIGLVTQIET